MSAEHPELEELLAPMRDRPIALSGSSESAALRARLLPGLRAEVWRTPGRLRRRRLVRRAGAGAAVLAAALVVWRVALPGSDATGAPEPMRVAALGTEPATWIDASGARHALELDADIDSVGELIAPDSSPARISTARGVLVELAARSRLRVTGPGRERGKASRGGLRLEQGEVHCRVPKLGAREEFSIATPDARIVVHGTVFSVRVGQPQSPRTCVRVTEGLVEVRHAAGSAYLRAGMAWGCQNAPEAQTSVAARAERPTRPAAREGSRTRRNAPAFEPRGTLGQENALLTAALAAEREHDLDRARTLFSTLLADYPDSPLAPDARAGLSRTR